MKALLDTHVLLWALASPNKIHSRTRKAIEDPSNQVFVSAASVWEIAIKQAIGKLSAPADLLLQIDEAGFSRLPVALHHAQAAGGLPMHHRDPFDRMLIAQALFEGLAVATGDARFALYGIATLPV